MTNWAYDDPVDLECTHNLHVVYTEEQILEEYWEYWWGNHPGYGEELPSKSEAERECVEDWIVVNWAYRTDEEPGVTITPIE